jgi:hypothetical protein
MGRKMYGVPYLWGFGCIYGASDVWYLWGFGCTPLDDALVDAEVSQLPKLGVLRSHQSIIKRGPCSVHPKPHTSEAPYRLIHSTLRLSRAATSLQRDIKSPFPIALICTTRSRIPASASNNQEIEEGGLIPI